MHWGTVLQAGCRHAFSMGGEIIGIGNAHLPVGIAVHLRASQGRGPQVGSQGRAVSPSPGSTLPHWVSLRMAPGRWGRLRATGSRHLDRDSMREDLLPTRVVSWNVARRREPWRQLVGMDADVALLQEAGNVPDDVADQVELGPREHWDTGTLSGTRAGGRTSVIGGRWL